MTAHLSDGFDYDELGFIGAVCMCGWRQGPFPDLGTAVDALMLHAAERAVAEHGDAAFDLKEHDRLDAESRWP